MTKKMNPRFKVWIEKDGEVVFAEGRRLLLETVGELGSLNAAAGKLGMSYRAAWGKIKATEQRLGIKLLESNVGGRGGGGARLTKEAKDLLRRYNRYKTRVKTCVDKEYKAIFRNKTS
ncbi:MAG: LysR family transcriptional regulator [Candidatus Brocadiales bacterium]|nr:LysR family transcriptional regulator [Candidatus Brocadiales bacterium]